MNAATNQQFVRQILDEVLASQAHQLLFITLKWSVLAGALGLVLAILSLIFFRKIGWYRSAWRFERWVRWPVWILTALSCAGLVATAGFFFGVLRGSEHVLRHSQLATKVFPLVSDALADGVAVAQVYLADPNSATRSQTNLAARIETFRAGGWEVNAPLLLRQMDGLQSGAASNLVAEVEARLVASSPQLQSGLPNKLLHHSLRLIGTMVVERKVNAELKRAHADDFYRAIRDRLVTAARQQGDPDTITHKELSAFLVQEVVVPGVMKPLRLFADSQIKLFLVLALLAVVVPPGAFKLTCGRAKQKTPGAPGVG